MPTQAATSERVAHDNNENEETRSGHSEADAGAKVILSGAREERSWKPWKEGDMKTMTERVKSQARDQAKRSSSSSSRQRDDDDDDEEDEKKRKKAALARQLVRCNYQVKKRPTQTVRMAPSGRSFIRLWPRKSQVRPPLLDAAICGLFLLLLLMQITRRTNVRNANSPSGLIIYQDADCAAPALFAAVSALEFSGAANDQHAVSSNSDNKEDEPAANDNGDHEHASIKTHVRVGE